MNIISIIITILESSVDPPSCGAAVVFSSRNRRVCKTISWSHRLFDKISLKLLNMSVLKFHFFLFVFRCIKFLLVYVQSLGGNACHTVNQFACQSKFG
eukprot:UN00793